MVFLDGTWSCVSNPPDCCCGVSTPRSCLRWTYRLSRRKWWKRCSPRLRQLRPRKTSRFQSLLRRQRFNRSLLKKEHRHRNSHKRRKSSCQSRARDRCRCRELKPSPLYAPRPQYPYEARSRRVTGSGVIVCTVDSGSGSVTGCSVSSSTGSPILDNAATSAFRQWRFRPGTLSKVNIPITFTMTGASY